MKPEHKALSEYYFKGNSISDAAKEAGFDEGKLVKLIKSIDEKAVAILSEFYQNGGSLGFIAEKYCLNRIHLYGYMHRNNYNANYDDEASKRKLISIQ